MKKSLVITTLSELTFQLDGEAVSGFSSRKAEALLVYLAIEKGVAHRRERLFTLLWPGMPEKSARNNLRQVLFALRKAFPEFAPPQDDEDPSPWIIAGRLTGRSQNPSDKPLSHRPA